MVFGRVKLYEFKEDKNMGIGMFKGLNREVEQIAKDKGIDKKVIIEAIQTAFLSAAKKKFGDLKEIEAQFNEVDEEIELFEFLKVVE
jgi:N utilization substance protein A